MKIIKLATIIAITPLAVLCLLNNEAKALELARPAVISGKNITSESITVEWNAVSGASQYEICFRKKGDAYRSSVTNANTATKNLLESNTPYNLKIRACAEDVDFSAALSDCEIAIEGCSKFTSTKTYKTLISLEDVKGSYESLYNKVKNKLEKYKEYTSEKLNLLSSETASDFTGEIDALSASLKTDSEAVQASEDYDAVNEAYDSLKATYKFPSFKSKLKIYKKINGYYKKFDKYQEKILESNEYKEKFDAHIVSAKAVYAKYEKQVADIYIDKLDEIKKIYNNLKKERQYKFTSLIYKQLNYLDKASAKMDKLKDKAANYSFLSVEASSKFDSLATDAAANYKKFINPEVWGDTVSYDAVSNRYKQMKKIKKYKKMTAITKGLKTINGILKKAGANNKAINDYAASVGDETGAIIGDLAIKSNELYKNIKDSAIDYENKILDSNNDASSIYKDEIRSYNGHKVYGYYYAGYSYLKDLSANKIDILASFIDYLECEDSEEMLAVFEEAKTALNSAKDKLISFKLDSYAAVKKVLYVEFKTEAKKADSKYKEALALANNCF